MALPVLPQINTLGSIDPHTLVLELPETSKDGLAASLAGTDDLSVARIYAHEMQHFMDIVGTVWGQDYLDILFGAYDAVLDGRPPELAYPELLRLFDADRSILFPRYYKYVMPGAPQGTAENRWSMSLSTGANIRPDGKMDETDPLLFVRFDMGAAHVARQPLTVGALLELRAIGAEMGPLARSFEGLAQDERIVEERLQTRELLAMVYDPQLTTYSAGAHVAANALEQADLTSTLDSGFKVAEVALNLTSDSFGRLRQPQGFGDAIGHQRQRGFGARQNRGYAFASLLFHMRGLVHGVVGEQAMALTLERAGLRSLDELHDAARGYIGAKRANRLSDGRLNGIRERLVDVGLVVLARRNYDQFSITVPQPEVPGPLVMTGQDLFEFHVREPILDPADTHFLVDAYSRVRIETRQALRAGRGMDFEWSDYIY